MSSISSSCMHASHRCLDQKTSIMESSPAPHREYRRGRARVDTPSGKSFFGLVLKTFFDLVLKLGVTAKLAGARLLLRYPHGQR